MKEWGSETISRVNRMLGDEYEDDRSPRIRKFEKWKVHGLHVVFRSSTRKWTSHQGVAEMHLEIVEVEDDDDYDDDDYDNDDDYDDDDDNYDDENFSSSDSREERRWKIVVLKFATYDQRDRETNERATPLKIQFDPLKMEYLRDRILEVAFEGNRQRRQDEYYDDDENDGPPHETMYCEACERGVCKKSNRLQRERSSAAQQVRVPSRNMQVPQTTFRTEVIRPTAVINPSITPSQVASQNAESGWSVSTIALGICFFAVAASLLMNRL